METTTAKNNSRSTNYNDKDNQLVFQVRCTQLIGMEAFDSTHLHTAACHTSGIRLLHVDNPDLTSVTGTTVLHITHFPADNQVRENLIHNVPSLASVSGGIVTYHGATKQTLSRPSEDSRDPPEGGQDILHQFNSEYNSMYMANLSSLLLLCGDVESNPGPTDRDEGPATQNLQTDEVSLEICICQILCGHTVKIV